MVVDLERHGDALLAIVQAVAAAPVFDERVLRQILRRHPRDGVGFFNKAELVAGYEALVAAGRVPADRRTLRRLQMKPVRTQSGVAPVAVLTKPAGCPGRCIFCPNDPAMPKSYLSLEPGAQRALQNEFDPYRQTRSRLEMLQIAGHSVQKAELLILGGTWSAYPDAYAHWFVQRCLDALNGCDSASLEEAQQRNERAAVRCVGITVETRPDWVTPEEVLRLRRLGVTRVQIGVQSLDDRILALNGRGHDVAAVRRACRLLRGAGFKLHLHWMPNLLGATPESDREDFGRLWSDPDLRPDELKIYPCSLLEGTELYRIWQAGGYQPYDTETLVQLLADCKAQVPPYCRLSRVVRDIPATYIVAGNRLSNLREAAQRELARTGRRCQCIRCREVRGRPVDPAALRLVDLPYETGIGQEHFLSLETPEGYLAGFLRLSLPSAEGMAEAPAELHGCAVIREVHVYGPALQLQARSRGEAQHAGIGRRLIQQAQAVARQAGFRQLAVIAAIGTREYYRRLGFSAGDLYMHLRL
ncbi:MAG: tRNA uridine(34) 5-carboxymethylaminomethyl modification radical SAM/GNAT enzyme Elp3 [Caldilineales bacterium]|nr:tRNA uridine(34) 5-carboxymethylaminomethyl modification radical SAM/GNAT enzyme Elp3 [Caldilineales bacterium]MDW8318913.1 tRNA uridine(34) 5-carboxymethylaminomethyl modification radical SAM/GNAT enzyme Elp3 [Anaerolineae bacterium]